MMHTLNLFQRFKSVVYVSIFVLCSLFLVACGQGSNGSAPAVAANFTTLGGQTFNSASLKGKVTLVNFWATSCTTCVAEMPMMVEQFKTHQAQGYRHIAVAMDYDPIAFVRGFATDRALPFDVVHDTDGSIAKAFGNVKLTPTSFLLDRDGNVVKRYVGAPKEADLKAAIELLLAKG